MADKVKQAISKREALNDKGEDCSDYTEATVARYTYLSTGKQVEWDVGHIENPVDRALAIEGFLNKSGHAVNKALNGKNATGDVDSALEDFTANLREGGWTNREGGNEVNLPAVLEALAKVKSYKGGVEEARAKWATFDEEQKTRVRTNSHIKAAISEARAARSKELAAKSDDNLDDI